MSDWIGNSKSVHFAIGTRTIAKEDRQHDDFYATDPIAAEWLCEIEDLDYRIWECACGQGHLAKVFERNGHSVKATDLIDRGYGQPGIDFLKQKTRFNGDIITNPPYKYATEFILKALDLVENGNKVCMFLKVQYLEGQKRRKLFEEHPPKTVWISSKRIKCGKNGKFGKDNLVAYAWFVWEKGYNGDTIVKWFN